MEKNPVCVEKNPVKMENVFAWIRRQWESAKLLCNPWSGPLQGLSQAGGLELVQVRAAQLPRHES